MKGTSWHHCLQHVYNSYFNNAQLYVCIHMKSISWHHVYSRCTIHTLKMHILRLVILIFINCMKYVYATLDDLRQNKTFVPTTSANRLPCILFNTITIDTIQYHFVECQGQVECFWANAFLYIICTICTVSYV